MAVKSFDGSKSSNELDLNDIGKPDTLRYNILILIINEEYDKAIVHLKDFLEQKSPYPGFRIKVERYIQHAIDLISAIRTKRNFPGFNSLTRTKQQELKEKFKEHFQELKHVIKKIENSMEELRLNDIKSTKIVVQSFWAAIVVVALGAFLLDIFTGMGATIYHVFDEKIGLILDWFYKILNIS